MSIKIFLDLPARYSCILDSSPMMVLSVIGGLAGVGHFIPVETSRGKAWPLTLRLLGPKGRVLPNVPIDGISS